MSLPSHPQPDDLLIVKPVHDDLTERDPTNGTERFQWPALGPVQCRPGVPLFGVPWGCGNDDYLKPHGPWTFLVVHVRREDVRPRPENAVFGCVYFRRGVVRCRGSFLGASRHINEHASLMARRIEELEEMALEIGRGENA